MGKLKPERNVNPNWSNIRIELEKKQSMELMAKGGEKYTAVAAVTLELQT
jgi:hypothetical protein